MEIKETNNNKMKCSICKETFISEWQEQTRPSAYCIEHYAIIGRTKICKSCIIKLVSSIFTYYEIENFLMDIKSKEEEKNERYIERYITETERKRREFKKKSNSFRKKIFERDAYRCVYCNSYENLHIDHIVPLSNGGENNEENLQILCQKCNLKKSNK